LHKIDKNVYQLTEILTVGWIKEENAERKENAHLEEKRFVSVGGFQMKTLFVRSFTLSPSQLKSSLTFFRPLAKRNPTSNFLLQILRFWLSNQVRLG
jgi:hypothetical protein